VTARTGAAGGSAPPAGAVAKLATPELKEESGRIADSAEAAAADASAAASSPDESAAEAAAAEAEARAAELAEADALGNGPTLKLFGLWQTDPWAPPPVQKDTFITPLQTAALFLFFFLLVCILCSTFSFSPPPPHAETTTLFVTWICLCYTFSLVCTFGVCMFCFWSGSRCRTQVWSPAMRTAITSSGTGTFASCPQAPSGCGCPM
jgi:hypothetical protein